MVMTGINIFVSVMVCSTYKKKINNYFHSTNFYIYLIPFIVNVEHQRILISDLIYLKPKKKEKDFFSKILLLFFHGSHLY